LEIKKVEQCLLLSLCKRGNSSLHENLSGTEAKKTKMDSVKLSSMQKERIKNLEVDTTSAKVKLVELLQKSKLQDIEQKKLRVELERISSELTKCTNWARIVGMQPTSSCSPKTECINVLPKNARPDINAVLERDTDIGIRGHETAQHPIKRNIKLDLCVSHVFSKHAGLIMIVRDITSNPIYGLNRENHVVCVSQLTGSAQEYCGKPAMRFRTTKTKINTKEALVKHVSVNGLEGLRLSCNIHQRNTKDDASVAIPDGMKTITDLYDIPTIWRESESVEIDRHSGQTHPPADHEQPEKQLKRTKRIREETEGEPSIYAASSPVWEVTNVYNEMTYTTNVRKNCLQLNPFGAIVGCSPTDRFPLIEYITNAIKIQTSHDPSNRNRTDPITIQDPFHMESSSTTEMNCITIQCKTNKPEWRNLDPKAHSVNVSIEQTIAFQSRIRTQGLRPNTVIWLPCPWLLDSAGVTEKVFIQGLPGLRTYLGFVFEWQLTLTIDEWWFLINFRKRVLARGQESIRNKNASEIGSYFFGERDGLNPNLFIQILLSLEPLDYPWRRPISINQTPSQLHTRDDVLTHEQFVERSCEYFNGIHQRVFPSTHTGTPCLDEELMDECCIQ
jgi:hypothetical protein